MNNQEYNTGDIQGDVIGAGSSGIAAKAIHGNVIQVIIGSEDVARQLGMISEVPTEVKQDSAAGIEGNKSSHDTKLLQDNISELLEVIRSSNRQGNKVNEIQAGELHYSQVELLLKKAILLKSEADQMYFDQLDDHALKDSTSPVHQYGTAGLDLDKVLSSFDDKAYLDKLREAYELLEEAIDIDPANTEVLLHMAQLLIELTPDDPTDEQKLLFRIQNLLNNPKDDSERFRLAQATFLLATTGNKLHKGMLRDARRMFKKLDRNEWVRQCDDLLAKAGKSGIAGPRQMAFEPSGHWSIQVSDYVGSTMELTVHPNGYFEATQQAGMYGMIVQATGQWAFMPAQRMLQLQGLVNGFQPFMLGIMIQHQQGNVFYGVGIDGYSYTLQKF
ncbi:MAG: tetratricopeptide repeat protein [Mariniphaga sp.]